MVWRESKNERGSRERKGCIIKRLFFIISKDSYSYIYLKLSRSIGEMKKYKESN